MRPMLDDLELPTVQDIASYNLRMLAEHKPPGMAGSLLQNMGRKPEMIVLWGVALGPQALVFVENLNDKFQAGQPLSFVADISADSQIDKVIIEDLQWEELAGKPERFGYLLKLREYISTAEPMTVEPPKPEVPIPPIVAIDEGTGMLSVEVIVEGMPDFDYSKVTVSVDGLQDQGAAFSGTLAQGDANIWMGEDIPAGSFTIKVEAIDAEPMTGTAEARVLAGQMEQVAITLHPAPSNIAKTFVVHFRMDNSFIEPAMCQVLERAACYASTHPEEKLIILGHTDLVGSEEYNQNLSERRARSAYAFLTFGRDQASREESINEWDTLRRHESGWQRDINDSWGTREYQFMLQNLGICYYYGNIDGVYGPKTVAAIIAFQKDNVLPPTGVMTDDTWRALIEKYMDHYSLAVPESQFFRNARDDCDGGPLKWLGAGEQDPLKNTQDAWRPNRRTELLYVRGDTIPCDVPKPRTFDRLAPGAAWCLGPDLNKQPEAGIKRVDFLSRQAEEPGKWLVAPAEPGKVRAKGVITKFSEDGPRIAHARYVLIAPNGEYLHTDDSGCPDLGERPLGEQRGQPIPNRADEYGQFSYPDETPEGTYVLEVLDRNDPAIARWVQSGMDDRGTIVFKQLIGPLTSLSPSSSISEEQEDVDGSKAGSADGTEHYVIEPITPVKRAIPKIEIKGIHAVVMTKSHTRPKKREITLRIDSQSQERWFLTCSGNTGVIKLYRINGVEIKFSAPEQNNSFSSYELLKGVKIFADAIKPSNIVDDYSLALSSERDNKNSTTLNLTAVELNLDLPPLIQPPKTPPLPGKAEDKWYKGQLVYVQDQNNSQKRVELKVDIVPAGFSGDLILQQVSLKGNSIAVNVTAGFERVKLFKQEVPGSKRQPSVAEQPLPNTVEVNTSALTTKDGGQFFIEGWKPSKSRRDIGFQLGLWLDRGGSQKEPDGDRVSLTVEISPKTFPRLVVALNEAVVAMGAAMPRNPAPSHIKILLDDIYGRLKTPETIDSQSLREDALEQAWSSQGADPLPKALPAGKEIRTAEEAWARQVTEMLTMTVYGGPGIHYFGDGVYDYQLLSMGIDGTDPGNPVYGLIHACQHLATFGVASRGRSNHRFKKFTEIYENSKQKGYLHIYAGSSAAYCVTKMNGRWIIGGDPPVPITANNWNVDPRTLVCSKELQRSDDLFKIKVKVKGKTRDNDVEFAFEPGSVFLFSNRQTKKYEEDDKKGTITQVEGNEEVTYQRNKESEWRMKAKWPVYAKDASILSDNTASAHAGFVLRTDPIAQVFQVLDTGGFSVLNRGKDVTLIGLGAGFHTGNFDDPACNEVNGGDPFRGVGVWPTMSQSEASKLIQHVDSVLKRARPLGLVRLILTEAGKIKKISPGNSRSFINGDSWLYYASPLLRMYGDDVLQNYSISRLIWSLRGISKENIDVQWWIYLPKGPLARAMYDQPRTTSVPDLAILAAANIKDTRKLLQLAPNKKPNISKILSEYTLPILEFGLHNDGSANEGKIRIRYRYCPAYGSPSFLHLAERVGSDGSIPLPMNKEFLQGGQSGKSAGFPSYFLEPSGGMP